MVSSGMNKNRYRIKIGSLKQTAHPLLSAFVIACCVASVGLLYIMQKSVAVANNLNTESNYQEYLQ